MNEGTVRRSGASPLVALARAYIILLLRGTAEVGTMR